MAAVSWWDDCLEGFFFFFKVCRRSVRDPFGWPCHAATYSRHPQPFVLPLPNGTPWFRPCGYLARRASTGVWYAASLHRPLLRACMHRACSSKMTSWKLATVSKRERERERDIYIYINEKESGPDKSLKSPMGFRCMHPFSHPCMTQRESRAPDFVCLYRCVDCAPSWSARQMSSGQRIAAWIPS